MEDTNSAIPFTGSISKDSDEIDLAAILQVLWSGKLIIFSCIIGCFILFVYYAVKMAEERYTARAELIFEQGGNSLVDFSSVIPGVSKDESLINTEISIIKSREIIERLVRDLDLISDPEFNPNARGADSLLFERAKNYFLNVIGAQSGNEGRITEYEEVLEVTDNVSDDIRVVAQPNTYILTISVTTSDPEKSSKIANSLVAIYLVDQLRVKSETMEKAFNFLATKLTELEAVLKQKEGRLRGLRSDSNLINIKALESLRLRAQDMREKIDGVTSVIRTLENKLEQVKSISKIENPYQAAQAIEDDVLLRIINGIERNEDGALIAFQKRLEILVQEIEQRISSSESQRLLLQLAYEELNKSFDEQSRDLSQFQQLESEVSATRNLFEALLARSEEISVQMGIQAPDSRILSKAIPGTKVAPRRSLLVAIGIFVGFSLGLAIVFLRELLRAGFVSVNELEETTKVSVLGQIPRMPLRMRHDLITYLQNNPTSSAAEAIRNLRTSILMLNPGAPPKVIMSTSSIPGEGKTTVSVGLAFNLAKMDKKVLLIEGDLRRNTLREYFNLGDVGGLSEILDGSKTVSEVIVRDEPTGIDILSGSRKGAKVFNNPADILSSEGFKKLLQDLSNAYEHIIIDTPPVLIVPDARVIGQLVDIVIYSVKSGSTSRQFVKDGIREFSQFGIKLDGLVLSQVNPNKASGYGYSYKYGSSYYGK